MSRLVVLTALLSTACSTQRYYAADLRQEFAKAVAPVNVTVVSPFAYIDGAHELDEGWFFVEPLKIVIVNETDEPALIDWDRSALVTPSGETLQIIHDGVSFPDAKSGNYQSRQKPSLIAPRAKLTEVVVPTAWIHLVFRDWRLCLKPIPKDSRFVLSITLDMNGKSTTLTTPFTVGEMRAAGPKQPAPQE